VDSSFSEHSFFLFPKRVSFSLSFTFSQKFEVATRDLTELAVTEGGILVWDTPLLVSSLLSSASLPSPLFSFSYTLLLLNALGSMKCCYMGSKDNVFGDFLHMNTHLE
jgi:hypothetical protein